MRLPISRYDTMEIRLHMLRAISVYGVDAPLIKELHNELKRRV